MATGRQIKLIWIERSLERYNRNVIEQMTREIKRLNVKEKGDLLQSLSAEVSRNDAEGRAMIVMADYGPFQDMGVGRGAGLKITRGKRRSKLTNRRAKRFYSPVVYGNLNSLIGMLQFGLTEDVVDRIKSELTTKS